MCTSPVLFIIRTMETGGWRQVEWLGLILLWGLSRRNSSSRPSQKKKRSSKDNQIGLFLNFKQSRHALQWRWILAEVTSCSLNRATVPQIRQTSCNLFYWGSRDTAAAFYQLQLKDKRRRGSCFNQYGRVCADKQAGFISCLQTWSREEITESVTC